MMIMMMMIFWGHSSCFIGLQERCAWSQSPVLRQSIVFCGEDGSMWDSTLPMNQPVEDPNWSHKSTGPCLNLFNGSCDSRILIDLDHSNPFLRCCQISGYRDILRHCGRWVLNHSAPSFWKRPLHRSSSIWFVLNLDTQGFPTQGTSEHLKVLVLVGFGVQVIPVLILVYLWFIYLLLCCRRVALRGKKQLAAGLRCNAGHSTSFLSMRMCQMWMGRNLWHDWINIHQPAKKTIRVPGFWATPRSGMIYINLQQKNHKFL